MASIQDLYSTVLNRTPSSSETDNWASTWGTNTPNNANAVSFWSAAQPELQNRAKNWQGGTVAQLYDTFLGRFGDTTGTNYWTQQFGDSVDANEAQTFLTAALPELQGNLSNLYSTQNTNPTSYTDTNGVYHGNPSTIDMSAITGNIAGTARPTSPGYTTATAPNLENTYSNMYQSTFTNPQQFWGEYSQGQGANTAEATARQMAAQGKTGLLPTLQTDLYKDYMSNYLPSVRKDLSSGLTYESSKNNTLANIYGQQLDYNKGIYSTDATTYGNQLNMAQAQLTAMTAASNQQTQLAIKQLETLASQYEVDNKVMMQIYSSMAQMFPNMSAADQQNFINHVFTAMTGQNYNANTSNTATTTNKSSSGGTIVDSGGGN